MSEAGAPSEAVAQQQRALASLDALRERTFRSPGSQVDRPAVQAADAELERSNRALEAAGDWRRAVTGLIRQGKARGLIDGNDAQLALLQRAVQAGINSGEPTLEALALAERSRVELGLGVLGPALVDARRAVHLTETATDSDARINALAAYARAQRMHGDVVAAAETAQAEVALASRASDRMTLYWALDDRADAYLAVAALCRTQQSFDACIKALDVAAADMRVALAIVRERQYAALVTLEESNLERIPVARSEIDSRRAAIQQSTAAWRNARSASDVWVVDRVVPTEGDQKNPLLSRLRAMIDAGEQMHRNSPRYNDPDFFTARGFVAQQEGHHDQAADLYLQAVAALEHDRRSIGDEHARSKFLGDRLAIYEFATLELLQQQRFGEAFDVIERSRSRVLADMLESRPPNFSDAHARELFGTAVTLREQIAAEQAAMFSDAGLDEVHTREPARVASENTLRQHEQAYEKLMARMAAETPTLASLRSSRSATLESLRRAMRDEDFELLQYMFTSMGLVIWHISATGSHVHTVLVLRGHVTQTMAQLADSLRHPQQPFDEASARELFYLMIGPIQANIASRHLVVLPFEGQVEFPFQALIDPADGRFFGERYQVTYAPSATVLLGLRKTRPLAQARAAALGDPSLPGANEEIAAVRHAFAGRGVFRADRRPREADVRSAVGSADVVHLAVHGEFDVLDPMSSHLVLDADGADDGRLTAAEMFGLRLDRGPLVVLSGCQTGQSVTTAQGESLGMSRGLLYSGANALLLSQWRVDSDATAAWMQAFYREAATAPLPVAAQIAAEAIRANPATRHPYYWAPFLLTAR